VVIRVAQPLIPGARYLVTIRGIRTAGGAVADSVIGQLQVPEPPKPVAADSTATPEDSTATPANGDAPAVDTVPSPARRR
jgi:hypothetical protein